MSLSENKKYPKNTVKEIIFNKGSTFLKSCRWLKKVIRNFGRQKNFFKIFSVSESGLKINFPQIFTPNIYDKSTPMAVYTVSTGQHYFLSICLAGKRQTDQKILNKQTLIVESSQKGAVRYFKMNPVICVIYTL